MGHTFQSGLWQCRANFPYSCDHQPLPPLPPPEACLSDDQALFLLAQASQRQALQARRRREARKLKRPRVPHPFTALPVSGTRTVRQAIGDVYETQACELLERAGLCILGRQLSCPAGEIDLVARDQDTLVCVEVRGRASLTHGGAAASVTRRKQVRLIRTLKWWLPRLTAQYFGHITPACRIDVISFDPHGVQWLQDAIRLEQDR